MGDIKYVRTENDVIIVFSAILQHSKFKVFNPKSAGFIMFYTDENGNPTCRCHGESIGLGLKSIPEEDTKLAKFQMRMIN